MLVFLLLLHLSGFDMALYRLILYIEVNYYNLEQILKIVLVTIEAMIDQEA